MKTLSLLLGILFVSFCAFIPGLVLAQVPPVPTPPPGRLLDAWEFSETNYLSILDYSPTSLTNVSLVSTWAGSGLQVDNTNAAWIIYPVVEPNGHTNLNLDQGTVATWLSPDWNSSDGLGVWGTIFEVGNWNTNLTSATGAWGLFISPDASTLFFSAQTNGVFTNYLNAPISWNAGDWHQITLTYSATNSALYLEGQFVTNGPGVTVIPGEDVLTNGFSIGSDGFGTGLLQSRAVYNNFVTYSYQLDADTISNNYASDSQNVSPLPVSGGGFHGDDDPPPSPGGGGGTNSGGGSPSYSSPDYGSNFFLVVLPLGTNAYNSDTNSVTLILTNTIPFNTYELLSTTNLQGTNTAWTLEQTLVSSSATNFTVTTVSMTGRPQLFFKALAYSVDSGDVGLPDWWQLANYGELGVDPYADPAGDGWSNLQKYQMGLYDEMGLAAHTFVTPGSSTSFAASLNTNGDIVMQWQHPSDLPSSGGGAGAVSGYTITYGSPGLSFTTNLTASQTNFNVPLLSDDGLAGYILFPTDQTSGYWGKPTITFQINYATTNSQIATNISAFDPTCFVNGAVVRGAGGATSLVISSPSQNLAAVRLISIGAVQEYPINEYGDFVPYTDFGSDLNGVSNTNFGFSWGPFNYIDIPISNFTNGAYQIPPSILPLFDAVSLNIMGVGENGNLGDVVVASSQTNVYDPALWGWIVGFNSDSIPFLDGRTNIAQNISFMLRGAGAFEPFDLSLGGAYDIHGYSNYVTSGFSFVSYDEAFWGYFATQSAGYTNLLQRNEFEPFEESAFLTNILFSTSLFDSTGDFTNQVDYAVQINSLAGYFPTATYVSANSNLPPAAISPVLNPTTSGNILSYDDFFYETWLTANSNGSFTFPSGAKNYYGLPYTAVTYFGNDQNFDVAHQGDTFYPSNDYFFQTVTAPTLTTTGYYFARPRIDSVPGESMFTVTNSTKPYFIIPIGTPFTLTAWATQPIGNGYSGVYAFPQQYFDKAYLADTNGNITTNQTGILSEYGDFFPVQSGEIFLTTKPDGATGTVGTNVVNIIGLHLDGNHDGTIDTTFTGPDNNSFYRPFVFWANNDFDRNDSSGTNQDDFVTASNPGGWLSYFIGSPPFADCNYTNAAGHRAIPCTRDLEDFTRLWIAGVTSNLLAALPTNSLITLSWGDVGSPNPNNPTIDLFAAAEANGGAGYLTNATIAAQQTNLATSPFVGRLGPGQSIRLNASTFSNHWAGNHFIWCGVSYGNGGLTLTIADASSNVLAQTVAYIQIKDIKNMYERWSVGDNPSIAPTNSAYLAENDLPPHGNWQPFQYATPNATNTPYILYVHGWNMDVWEKDRWAETAYKRLYWHGYQGRFGVFRWPCNLFGYFSLGNYDVSEQVAWQSGQPLESFLTALNTEYPSNVYVLAHSMGNVVTSEALRLAGTNTPVNTYVASQAAVSARAYDNTIPADATNSYPYHSTPDTEGHYYNSNSPPYFTGIGGVVTFVDFYNKDDYALGKWVTDQSYKPDISYYYETPSGSHPSGYYQQIGTNAYRNLAFGSNTYEIFARAVPSYSFALGAETNIAAPFSRSVNLDVAPYNFGNLHVGHSLQFRNDNMTSSVYWQQLLSSFSIQP